MKVNLPQNWDSLVQQNILDGLPALVFLERAGRVVFANAEARRLTGLGEEKWVTRPVEEVLWGLFPGTAEPKTALIAGDSGSPFHATLATRDGRLVPVEGAYCPLNSELRDAVIVAHAVDREPTPRPRLMEDVLGSLPEAVAIVRGSRVLFTNPAFTRMFGYAAEEVSGADLRNFIVPETRLHEHAMIEKAVEDYGRAALETVCVNKDGQMVDVAMHAAPLLVNGAKAGNVLTWRDIGERRQVEARIEHDALHDVLTGLPNRTLFHDRLGIALVRRSRRREGCGILCLDVDHFKSINGTLGHAAGDVLLMALADRLRSILRPQDTAARLGGDEFAILIEGILNVSDLEVVARRVLAEMERPFDIFGYALDVSVSIGVAMAGPNEVTVDTMLRDADLALYRARQADGKRYEVFDSRMGVETSILEERERDLRHALSHRKFEFWFEPVFRLATGELESFESVLRFRRGDGSIDTFNDLLPAAEETGLSVSIGRETLETACRQLRDWAHAIPGNTLTLAVNLTQRQFYHEDMAAHLKKTVAVNGIDPSRLVLEVPESALNERPDAALAIVQRLKDCGARVALDEFGSGLAAFNHLVRMPVDVVKMDGHLSGAAIMTGGQFALLESVIRLGKTMGVQLLATGVESQEQLNALGRLGCELGQGPLLSEIVDAGRALEMAVEHQRVSPGA
jgi:diguanylate cyclase (GGDEF)-like protein/PAS domain S-box-containing protein